MTERYCEGERFADLSFTEEAFEDCDFTDCVFVDCSFTKCELDHTTLNECKFVRCEITGLRSTHSSVQSLDFEDCRLQEIEWAPLMSNGAFPDPIHTLKECSLKYNTFTEMNFNRFDFSDGNEIVENIQGIQRNHLELIPGHTLMPCCKMPLHPPQAPLGKYKMFLTDVHRRILTQ